MRCFTLSESNDVARGLRVTQEPELGFGVVMGDALLPLEQKISWHLSSCENALYARAGGEFHPCELLGEKDRAELTPDDAKDILEEAIEGWYVDYLSVDPETLCLHNSPHDARETRCLLLIMPIMDKGATITYMSNVHEERLVYGRVVRDYAPIEEAVGIEVVFCDGSWSLLKLERGAGFRVRRSNCQTGWRECVAHWNGYALRHKAYGLRPARAQRAA